MTIITEGGLLPSRIEFVPETVQGVTPTDPAWELPSERITDFDPGYSVNFSEDSGLGEVDYSREIVTEESEMSMTYALQRWFLDGAGGLQDLSAYGMVRASSNRLPSSVSMMRRISSGDVNPDFANAPLVQPGSTVDARYNPASADDGSGSSRKVTRAYDVLKGVDVGETTPSAERGNPRWQVEMTGQVEHARSYRIDQPTSDTDLVVFSTDSADTDFQVEIESEGATTSTSVTTDSTDGTTLVVTGSTYTDIDAVQISDPNGNIIDETAQSYAGNIVIAENSGTATSPTEGEWLAVFHGTTDYENTYADPGIPTLGAGSRASPISTAGERPKFYKPQNMRIERPVGSAIEHAGGVQSVEMAVSNNVERTPSEGREQTQHHGMRGVETSLTSDGETLSTYMQGLMMRGQEETTRIIFNRAGDEFVDNQFSIVNETDTGDSAGENATEREFTIMPQIGPDGEPALNISTAGSGPY